MSTSFYMDMFSILLWIYQSVNFLGVMITLFNFLSKCQTFPQYLCHLTFPPAASESSNFFVSSVILVVIHLFNYSHPCSCKLQLVVLICVSLFSHAYWSFMYLLSTNIYSNLLPIFKMVLSIFLLWVVRILHIIRYYSFVRSISK